MLEGDHEQDDGGVRYCLVTDVSDRDVGDLVVTYDISQSVSQSRAGDQNRWLYCFC